MNRLALTIGGLLLAVVLHAQVDARLLRYPDVSETHLTFAYANAVWVVPKSGGLASRLSSPPGEETFPRFSPDGSRIAFSGNYDGNTDVYVVPAFGGSPVRLTYHGMSDRVLDWYPDGRHVLFASSRYSGKQRFSQFFKIGTPSGLPEQLPVPYGEYASLSDDGKRVAYTKRSVALSTWKRYRGGMASDIILFNLETLESETISPDPANDEMPMWRGNRVYFLSDRGPSQRYNLYVYDLDSRQTRQLTNFSDFDVHFPSIGPRDLVFEAGGGLYLLDLETEQQREVTIQVVTDQQALAQQTINAADNLQNLAVSPAGKRVVAEARGELFSVPATEGVVKNLTSSSGSAQRYPAYSPDGKEVAYWSDENGEYNLMILNLQTGKAERQTDFKDGFRYQLFWAPDGRKLAFADQAMKIQYYDRDRRTVVPVDTGTSLYEGDLRGFLMNWSPDSRYLAYGLSVDNGNNAIFIRDTRSGRREQVTSGFYHDNLPVFDPEGRYLFFTTNRHFQPVYGDLSNDWTYPNSTQLAAVPLRRNEASPLAPKNDLEEWRDPEAAEEEQEEEKTTDKKGKTKDDEQEKADKEQVKPVTIDFDGFEQRMVILPPAPGNYGRLAAAKGKLIYQRIPRTGSADDAKATLVYYDLEEREEKTILEGVDQYQLSADGEHLLVGQERKFAIVAVAADQKMDKPVPTGTLEMVQDPRAEWRQIFNDVWRFERDFFYDPNMHGVDWAKMRGQYGELVESAGTREDLNFIIGELIGELNASHTYRGGGDVEAGRERTVGYLGVDWELADGKYRIRHIVRGAPWDSEVRSPIDAANADVREGDFILAVNGRPLTADRSPYAAFDGLAGKPAELTIERSGKTHTAVVELLSTETRLRNLAWIESNRRRVEEATGGRVGYVYVPSTGRGGQNELVRMFYGQWNKDALIIDERFNDGGQIPDRFVELLNREPLAFWAVRHGERWQWPPRSHFGPKVMLINGWSGSGGDAFPDYFRKAGLGPLIGTRTWGGLIGLSGSPDLVDGGYATVPTFRMYDPNGKWFLEGQGVSPDVEVDDDPTIMARGRDPQLEKAIEVLMQQLKENPRKDFSAPAYETRVPEGKG